MKLGGWGSDLALFRLGVYRWRERGYFVLAANDSQTLCPRLIQMYFDVTWKIYIQEFEAVKILKKCL